MRGTSALGLLLLTLGHGVAAEGGDTSRADALFAKRDDPRMLEAAVDAYEAAGAPLMVARGCLERLELFDDVTDEDARLRWIERGLKAGEKALGTDDVPGSLDRLKKPQAEALYWYAALYGRKIELSSVFSQSRMAKKFREMAERAAELDGTVFYGGPHRMLGSFYADAPWLMGGDWKKAILELDRAVEIAPNFFENRVTRAELADVHKKDRDAFRKDLQDVIAARDDVLPAVIPEQRRAKAAAKKLLAREAELF